MEATIGFRVYSILRFSRGIGKEHGTHYSILELGFQISVSQLPVGVLQSYVGSDVAQEEYAAYVHTR